MKKIISLAASVALFLGVSTAAQAQEESEAYNFVGVQAGAQATLTHFGLTDLITPQFAIQAGRYFNDKVGARLHLQGYQINSGFQADRFPFVGQDTKYSFKDVTADLDMLVNLSNIINPARTNKALNWYGVVGFGVNYTWGTDEFNNIVNNPQSNSNYYVGPILCGDKHASFNGRLGTGVEYKLSNSLALSFEADANYKNDQFNYKFNDRCDWQVAAFVGLTYKLGAKKKAPVIVEPVYATRVDTVWYDDTEYKTKVVTEQFTCDDHFQIRESQPVSESVITKVTDFVKTYKNVKVSVTGYADKGTGNPTINMKYSQQRAEAVAEALKAAGVPAEIMTVEWKGDTEQPFAENDANRAAIVKVSGETEQKYPVTVKKYRTQEVRYQVQ